MTDKTAGDLYTSLEPVALDTNGQPARDRRPGLNAPCFPGYQHVWLTESDGAKVCQVCGDLNRERGNHAE